MKTIKLKMNKQGLNLDISSMIRTFKGKSGKSYLVIRQNKSFHVFAEVVAKFAAKDCGATWNSNTNTHTQRLWNELWKETER